MSRPDARRLGKQEFGGAHLVLAVLTIGGLVVAARRIFSRFEVAGASMAPAYNPGDYLICERISPRLRRIRNGQVVVFDSPVTPGLLAIKRVAGVEGDTVLPRNSPTSGIEVAEGEVFVTGDNPPASTDSRHFGPIQVTAIRGVARIRYRRGPRPTRDGPDQIPA